MHLYSAIYITLRHQSMVLEILTAKDQANLALSQWETAGEAPGTAFVL